MNQEPIPSHPVPLTAEQATAMEQLTLKKHDVAIVLLHWFNAFVWLLELITGVALIVKPEYRVAPAWYSDMVRSAVGSAGNLLRVHITIGVAWIVVFCVYGIFGYRNYLHHEVLINEVGLDKDDFNWLRIRLLLTLGRSKEELPPQGSYNAGQKMYALLVYSMVPVIMVSGLIMAFHLFATAVVAWAMVLHFVAVGLVVSGLMVHFYMGGVFPEERPAFFSMITGRVNELYAYKHHFKWWREAKIEERRWQQQFRTSDAPGAPKSN